MVTDELVKQILPNAKMNGSRTHFIGVCPYCHKDKHLYIQRETTKVNLRGENVSWFWQCKRCGEQGKFKKLLAKFGLIDKYDITTTLQYDKQLQGVSVKGTTVELLPEFYEKEPVGFKRVLSDPYFAQRGYPPTTASKYKCGRASVMKKNAGYLFFVIEEFAETRGYVGRDTTDQDRARYLNSKSSFEALVGGIDSFKSGPVVLVEGYFDKVNIDHLFNSQLNVGVTFGKKLSVNQIQKLISVGTESLFLLWDLDAIKNVRETALKYSALIDIKCAYIPDSKDPGAANRSQIFKALKEAQSPITFAQSTIVSKIKR